MLDIKMKIDDFAETAIDILVAGGMLSILIYGFLF